MDNINVWVYENGFQNSEYNKPNIPVYMKKGNLSVFDFHFKPHWHSDFEIIRVTDGIMKYNIDGHIIEIHKNDVLFVNSNRMHFGYSDSKTECNYICIVFDYNLLCANGYIKDNYVLNIVNDECCPYLIVKNSDLNNIIDKLFSLSDSASYDLKIQSGIYNIFSYIFEAFCKSPKNEIEKKNYSKIRKIIDFINVNYRHKITLNDIAKAGNVSKNSCINYFKEVLGLSPIDYLIKYRLEKSTELLVNTDLSITQIANDTGFSSSSHYCKLYKRLYNMTPRQMRLKHK